MSLLSLQTVTKIFGGLTAVDGFNLMIGRDEITGELRPSEKSILLGETDEVLVRPAE